MHIGFIGREEFLFQKIKELHSVFLYDSDMPGVSVIYDVDDPFIEYQREKPNECIDFYKLTISLCDMIFVFESNIALNTEKPVIYCNNYNESIVGKNRCLLRYNKLFGNKEIFDKVSEIFTNLNIEVELEDGRIC